MHPAASQQVGAGAGGRRPPLRALVYSSEPRGGARGFVRRAAPLRCAARRVELLWGVSPDGHTSAAPELLESADLVVLHRLFAQPHSAPLLERIFAAGRPLLVDLDDWLLDVPAHDPAHAAAERGRPLLLECLARADAVSCPSEPLAALLGALNPDVTVLPDVAPEPPQAAVDAGAAGGPELRLGCVGSGERAPELERIEPALLALAQRLGPRLRLYLLGGATPRLRALPGAVFLPGADDAGEQLRRLAELRLDLAVSPLGESLFERCRSPRVWLELCALGVPGVYADREPYRVALEHGRSGWLCGEGPDAWLAALSALCEDGAQRARLAQGARERVRAAHTAARAAPRFEQLYERVASLRRAPRRSVIASAAVPLGAPAASPSAGAAAQLAAAPAAPPRPAEPLSSIVIPVYGRAELTQQCLRALLAAPPRHPFEIIVVDNASPDHTASVLAQFGEHIRVLRNAENRGFAVACNQGARAARGEHLVFLNNDTIPQRGWLEALQSALEVPGVQIAGSKLLYADGTVQHAGVAICSLSSSPYHIFQGLDGSHPAANRRREMQIVTGACMLVRRPLFEALQGFDEAYRNSFEDVDLCLRARLRGARVLYEPRSWLYHLESQTPGRHAHESHNQRILRERWGSAVRFWDEAAQLAAVGVYRRVRVDADGRSASQAFHRIRPGVPREAWWRVAAVQRRLLAEGFEAVEELIQPPPRWPSEPAVLGWAARLCAEHGRGELARALLAHMGEGFFAPDPELEPAPAAPGASAPPLAPAPGDWDRAVRAQLDLL